MLPRPRSLRAPATSGSGRGSTRRRPLARSRAVTPLAVSGAALPAGRLRSAAREADETAWGQVSRRPLPRQDEARSLLSSLGHNGPLAPRPRRTWRGGRALRGGIFPPPLDKMEGLRVGVSASKILAPRGLQLRAGFAGRRAVSSPVRAHPLGAAGGVAAARRPRGAPVQPSRLGPPFYLRRAPAARRV